MGDVAILGTGIIGFIGTLTYYLCHIKDIQVTATCFKDNPELSFYRIPQEQEDRYAWTPSGATPNYSILGYSGTYTAYVTPYDPTILELTPPSSVALLIAGILFLVLIGFGIYLFKKYKYAKLSAPSIHRVSLGTTVATSCILGVILILILIKLGLSHTMEIKSGWVLDSGPPAKIQYNWQSQTNYVNVFPSNPTGITVTKNDIIPLWVDKNDAYNTTLWIPHTDFYIISISLVAEIALLAWAAYLWKFSIKSPDK
jgi:hypothetical protein